jgi:hypothetical protein
MDVPINKPISITLEVQQWNTVIQVLAEGAYKVVQPIIYAIGQQAAVQTAPSGNGAIYDEPPEDRAPAVN